MERRRAVAIATATTATTVATIAANFGLLGFGQAASSPVGQRTSLVEREPGRN